MSSFWGAVGASARGKRAAIIDVVAVAGLWQLSTLFLPRLVAPPLPAIWHSLLGILTNYGMLQNLVYTVARVVVGIAIASALGVIVGLLMGLWRGFQTYTTPLVHLIQGVPSLSWVVLAVIWFRGVEVRIDFILVIVLAPSFALYTAGAVRSVPTDLQEVVIAFRARHLQRFRLVIWPSVIPAILSAWEVNLGTAVRVVVVAELVGATTGVGFELLNSQSVLDMAGAIAWTVLLVLVLLVFQGILKATEKRLLAWRPRLEGQA